MSYVPSISISAGEVQLTMAVSGLLVHKVFRDHSWSFSVTIRSLLLLVPPFLGAAASQTMATTPGAWLLCFGTYWGVFLLSLVAYRVSPFHPLACYPGPFLCRSTGFWMALAGRGGRRYLYVQTLHERYGDIVRIGPNELSVRDPSFVEPIYGTNGLPRQPTYLGNNTKSKEVPTESAASGTAKIEAIAPATLMDYRPLLTARVRQLLEGIGGQNEEIDISRWVHHFSYDFMADVAFGGGSELMRQLGDTDDAWGTLGHAHREATLMQHVSWRVRCIVQLPSLTTAQRHKLRYLRMIISERIRCSLDSKVLLDDGPGEGQLEPNAQQSAIPIPHLSDGTLLAVIAGADTISSTLTNLLFCLLTHPRVYMRLQEEIDQFYPPGEDPCDRHPPLEMHYLTAVINETLRLYPPIPSDGQRVVPGNGGGILIGPRFIPPGTAISLHNYSVQRDPRNFHPCPSSFWPNRWLLASGHLSFEDAPVDEYSFVHNQGAFTPFSHGLSNRVGESLAMRELRIVLCAILQRYDLRLGERWNPEAYTKACKENHAVVDPPSIPVLVCLRT
ncbi:hypothetical protein ONZ51_g11136 [Trametes cubensis]|uniref:Cytochrome P450 n=1 Tax=Trametes cubensis TaxID=1111947 RepID=A0AAD7TI31_9APHY|nr:hypothetical protein ONZ51_g11136 [Trametes cubensis]